MAQWPQHINTRIIIYIYTHVYKQYIEINTSYTNHSNVNKTRLTDCCLPQAMYFCLYQFEPFSPLSLFLLHVHFDLSYTIISVDVSYSIDFAISGFCRLFTIVKDGERFSTSKDFLRPIMSRQNLHVSTHSTVIKVCDSYESRIPLRQIWQLFVSLFVCLFVCFDDI